MSLTDTFKVASSAGTVFTVQEHTEQIKTQSDGKGINLPGRKTLTLKGLNEPVSIIDGELVRISTNERLIRLA